MEIRFCTVCNESIPDPEFDSGRALVSGGESLLIEAGGDDAGGPAEEGDAGPAGGGAGF